MSGTYYGGQADASPLDLLHYYLTTQKPTRRVYKGGMSQEDRDAAISTMRNVTVDDLIDGHVSDSDSDSESDSESDGDSDSDSDDHTTLSLVVEGAGDGLELVKSAVAHADDVVDGLELVTIADNIVTSDPAQLELIQDELLRLDMPFSDATDAASVASIDVVGVDAAIDVTGAYEITTVPLPDGTVQEFELVRDDI